MDRKLRDIQAHSEKLAIRSYWLSGVALVGFCLPLVFAPPTPLGAQDPQEQGVTAEEAAKRKAAVAEIETQYYRQIATGDFEAVLASVQRIMELEQGLYAADDPSWLNTHKMVAESLASCERFDEAQEIAQALYETCLNNRGPKHWRTVDARFLLDDIAQMRKLAPEDRQRLKRVRQIASSVNSLVIAGQVEQALREAEESLSICRELLGELHPTTLYAEFDLANTSDWADRDEEAFKLFQLNVEHCKKSYSAEVCPEGHPKTALALFFVADLALRIRDRDQAEQYLLESLEIRRRIYPPEFYPRGHMDIIRCLHQLGQINEDYSSDRYKKSQAYYDEALALLRKLDPPNENPRGSLLLVNCLSSCAEIRYSLGRHAESLPFRFEAVEVCRRLYPVAEYPHGTSPFANALRKLASTLSLLSRQAESLAVLKEALPMYEAIYSIEDFPLGYPSLSLFYHDLGLAYHHAQYPFEGLNYVRRALEMDRTYYSRERYPRGQITLVYSLIKLADMLDAQRQFDEVPSLLQEAEEMATGLILPDDYPRGHSVLGLIQYRWGQYHFDRSNLAVARNYFTKALEYYERLYPPDIVLKGNVQLADCMDKIASTLLRQGEYEAASQFYQRNLVMRLRFFPKETHPNGHLDLATAHQNLAMTLKHLKRYQEAETHFREALAMSEKLFPPDLYPNGSFALATVNDNLGNLYMTMKKYDEAVKHYAEAVRINLLLYPPDRYPHGHESIIYSVLNMNSALIRLGTPYEQWRSMSDKVALMADTLFPLDAFPHGHSLLLDALKNRWAELLTFEEVDAARKVLERLLALRLDYAWHEMSHTSTDILVRYMDDLEFDYDALLSLLLLEGDPDPELLAQAYDWGVMQKSIVIDSLVRNRNIQRELATDPQLAALDTSVRKLRLELASIVMKPSTEQNEEDLHDRQELLAHRLQNLENELTVTLNQRAGEAPGQGFSLAALEDWLSNHPDTAVVEIIEVEPFEPGISKTNGLRFRDGRYVAFVLVPGRQLQLVDLGEVEAINEKLVELREFVGSTARSLRFSSEEALEEEYVTLANELHNLVFLPLKPVLGEVGTVCLALDGELNRVPFPALVDSEGRYLIENYAFGYLSSSSDLLRPRAPLGDGVFVFADPAYDLDPAVQRQIVATSPAEEDSDLLATRSAFVDATRGLSWTPLPATAAEAELIGQLFSDENGAGVVTYTDEFALEERLKQIHRPRILHLATHGYYLEFDSADTDDSPRVPSENGVQASQVQARLKGSENPLLRSGMVLAGANTLLSVEDRSTDAEDGWITAEEVAMLDLLGTELVVLSACETGLGDLRAGENVSGLRRAFLQAGARRLITSLYKVPDEATQELMSEFYERVADGMSPLNALREAQLAMIANRREAEGAAHPFFWASFILVGDPG